MHQWGDAWFEAHGADLDAACDFLRDYCRRYARLGGDVKEKWGTLRFYAHFHHQLHDLFYPGYAYCQWPYWLWIFDLRVYCSPAFNAVRRAIQTWQIFIYRRAYRLTVQRWPHLFRELLFSADYPEFLKHDPILKGTLKNDL